MGKVKKDRMIKQKRKMHKLMMVASRWRDVKSFQDGLKEGYATWSGGGGSDKYIQQVGLVTNQAGQYISIANNANITGDSGIVQPGRPRTLYDFCIQGEGFCSYQVVPFEDEVIPASQFTFNWVLMYVPNGYSPDDILNNMTPPIFVPSVAAASQKITLEAVNPQAPGTYVDVQGNVTYAQEFATTIVPGKRKIIDDGEQAQADAKRRIATPGAVSVQQVLSADPVAQEIIFPRQNVIASGTGTCIYNSQTVTNAKIKAYSATRLHTKVDDQIVLFVKTGGQNQFVTLNLNISYKESF